MIPATSGNPVSKTTIYANHQLKRNIEPFKIAGDDLSETSLLKKLFRRKLSTCLQKINTGKYRPKATNACRDGDGDNDDDGELGAPRPKKQRLDETEKGRWNLSERGKEEENSSSAEQEKRSSRDIW